MRSARGMRFDRRPDAHTCGDVSRRIYGQAINGGFVDRMQQPQATAKWDAAPTDLAERDRSRVGFGAGIDGAETWRAQHRTAGVVDAR